MFLHKDEVLEIGTGAGVIPVLLSRLNRFKRMFAVEIQKELADIAAKNVAINGIHNVEIVHADIRNLENFSCDLIFSNPPYRRAGSGKLNPHPQKAVARHELELRLENVFESAAKFLKPEGRLSMILPTFREAEFAQLADRYSLHPAESQYVQSFAQEPPVFFLATVTRCKTKCEQTPKLVIYEAPGIYSAEIQNLLKKED